MEIDILSAVVRDCILEGNAVGAYVYARMLARFVLNASSIGIGGTN